MVINILSEETIDKIAAGEVIERPSSVVKELVENAIDAGAKSVTVEIKEGGISFIRVTDNGSGIEASQIKKAFYRHATSKLTDASDLAYVSTLGFRGEALSSIAAVSQVELITKTADSLTGVRYVIEGTKEVECTEVGVPTGTTIIVRNLFFNTPVRKKFLKSPTTEGTYIYEICERMALSKPNVSFQFIQNGQVKFHTSGDGDLQELVYRIYGKEIAKETIPIYQVGRNITISGILGKPTITRSNRNYENYFVNGRYIKSQMLSSAVEEGYSAYLMQHKFPFFIINFEVNSELVDVNVHPTKMEVRFSNGNEFYDYIASTVSTVLKMQEFIPDISLSEEPKVKEKIEKAPEPFEMNRIVRNDYSTKIGSVIESVVQNDKNVSVAESNIIKAERAVYVTAPEQMTLFETPFLSKEAEINIEIIGQIFDTYWLFSYGEKLLIMDQHAAHEKVKYERLVEKIKNKSVVSQTLNPPIIVTLKKRERDILETYMEYFEG